MPHGKSARVSKTCGVEGRFHAPLRCHERPDGFESAMTSLTLKAGVSTHLAVTPVSSGTVPSGVTERQRQLLIAAGPVVEAVEIKRTGSWSNDSRNCSTNSSRSRHNALPLVAFSNRDSVGCEVSSAPAPRAVDRRRVETQDQAAAAHRGLTQRGHVRTKTPDLSSKTSRSNRPCRS